MRELASTFCKARRDGQSSFGEQPVNIHPVSAQSAPGVTENFFISSFTMKYEFYVKMLVYHLNFFLTKSYFVFMNMVCILRKNCPLDANCNFLGYIYIYIPLARLYIYIDIHINIFFP